MAKAVGIDFGTTKSVLAVVQGGKPSLLPNAAGDRSTPSVVAFVDGQHLIGASARRQAVLNPGGTIFGVPRLLGQTYQTAYAEMARAAYLMERGPQDRLSIRVRQDVYSPEEIAAVLLRSLAEDSAQLLGERVEKVVVTVPASFSAAQRQALCDAHRLAGLHVQQILNASTAAILAYSAEKQDSATVLLVDLGGGGCSVALFDVGGGVCEARVSIGDPTLSGDRFDTCLVEYVTKHFQSGQQLDLQANHQALQRLYEAVERAKCELSSVTHTRLSLPDFVRAATGSHHLDMALTRTQFETLTTPLGDRCAALVQQALTQAQMSPDDIDEVLLVGGASRMPMIPHRLKELLGQKTALLPLYTTEMAAVGAALHAGILDGTCTGPLVFDVTSLCLSVKTADQTSMPASIPVIEPNTPLPCRKTLTFSPPEDNPRDLELTVLQTQPDSPRSSDDSETSYHVLIQGLRSTPPASPARQDVPQVAVTFDIDTNGLLSVSAIDQDTGSVLQVTLNSPS